MKTSAYLTTYMARAAMMLLVALFITTDMKAKTPYAIFCEANKTFYFTNRDAELTESDTFTPEGTSTPLTITALWSGTDVSASSGITKWYLNSIIKENTVTVVFEPSFLDVSPASTESWFDGFKALKEIQGLEYMSTSIGKYAFYECSGLTSLTIPNSVTSIGNGAFYECSGLTSLTIPNSVTSIGNGAFRNCSGLTSLTIPNSVTSIGESAFKGCSGLTSLTIPNSVTSIGESAFKGCSGLKSLTIPNSVTSIGNSAFENCSGLTSMTIPNSVTSIGNYAFQNCSGLKSLTIPNSVTSIGESAFKGCSGLKSLTIPNSVTNIGNGAFQNCSGLKSLTIPNSVTNIGDYVFSGCSCLTSLTIPNSVTSIGNNAFYGCSGMVSVTIGSGVTSIGNEAFKNCSGLKSLTIPNSVTSIGSSAFENCSGLTSMTIPNSVTSIGNSAFYNCSGLTSLTIPNSVTNIGNFTFYNCSGLTSLTIPNSVTSIGNSAFEKCSGLTSLTIPNSVTSIGESAFKGCSGLTSLTIPNSVTSIGKSAFEKCSGLTSMTIPNSVTSIGENTFRDCSGLTSVTIPNSVTSIGNYAFQNCSGLTSMTIPNRVTSIGEYFFSGCSGLTSVTIGSRVTNIGMDAFNNCRNISDVYCYADPSDLTWGRCGKYDFKEDKGTRFHVFDEGAWSSKFGTYNVTFVGDLTIRLEDKADNTDLIASFNNQNRSVTLLDRTIYKDGSWTTLCLPFNLSSLTGTPLEGFTVKELDIETPYEGHKTGLSEGTLYLNFKDADGIVAGKPYIVKRQPDLIIKSEDDWNTFAQNVSKGTSYEGKVVGLGNDISVSTMVDGNFRGTFDGNGHTISVNLNGGGEGLALFYTIDGATIQNVKAKGTVTSSNHRPATFTSFVEGNSTINNCWSSVDIVSTKTSNWVDGGAFVARVSTGATLNMTDCLFTGSITYNGGTTGGGMVGFTQTNATANLTNCLFSPSALTLTVNAYSPCVFVSGDQRGNLKNCYYNAVAKASALENEGIDGSSMASAELASALGTNWVVSGNNVIPDNIPGIKNPVFGGVIISSAEPTTVTSDDGAVSFSGSYKPTSLTANDGGKLYLDAASTLRHPAAVMTVGSGRACFQLNGGLVASQKGDVNGDKAITVTDVMALVGNILGHTNDNFISNHADTNGDGKISVTDVMKLVNMILQGNQIAFNVVVNTGDNPITYDDGASGSANAAQNSLWEE